MKQSLVLGLLLLLTASLSNAGEVRVSINGEIDVNLGGPGDIYGSVSKGSSVQLTFRVLTPGSIIQPGQLAEYDIVPDTFRLEYVGLAPVTIAGPATVRLSNTGSGRISLIFDSNFNPLLFSNGTSGYGTSWSNANSVSAGEVDLEQLSGLYMPAGGLFLNQFLMASWFSFTVDSPLEGTRYCEPMDANSSGESTELTGTLAAGPGTPLHLEPRFGPAQQFGYILVGSAEQDPGSLISEGRLCLSQAAGEVIGRFNQAGTPLNSLGQFDVFGRFVNLSGTSTTGFGFDVPSNLPISGNPTIVVGQTWHYQLWHRDIVGGASVSNFSNGLTVVY